MYDTAQKIQGIPGMEYMGKALSDALASKNTALKNAALFSLVQNPNTRQAIDSGQ